MKSQTCLGTSYWKRKFVWLFDTTVRLPEPGHLEKDFVQSQRFLKTTDSHFFFCKRTNNIHEFEGCFLRGQVRSNAFKVLVPLQEKLENLLFSEIVVIGQSSSKCPSSSSRTVKDRYSWLAFVLQQLINSKWRLFMLPMGTSLESLYFFRLHGIDLAGSNFIFLVINRTYEAIGHTFYMSTRGKLYVNFVTLMTEEIFHEEIHLLEAKSKRYTTSLIRWPKKSVLL